MQKGAFACLAFNLELIEVKSTESYKKWMFFNVSFEKVALIKAPFTRYLKYLSNKNEIMSHYLNSPRAFVVL